MHTPWTGRLRTVVVAAAVPLLVAGCGAASGDSSDRPRVAASFYPLAYVAERVTGEHAEVVNLTSPGVDPHDLELSVRETAEVAEADLVVYEAGMQPAVDEAVAEHGPDNVVEATEVVDLRAAVDHDHEGEAGEHGHGARDLHFWTDPARMVELAAAVREAMKEADPRRADAYDAAFEDLREDLLALDRDYERRLADCRIDTVVVSHEAFGYLEKYGLHFEPIAGLSPGAEPSAAHLTELAELVRTEGVTTIFSETLASPAMAETLARDLGVETAVLDPVEGLGDETAGEDYLSLMRRNLDTLEAAQECR